MVLYGTLMIVMVQVRPGEVRHPRPGAGRQRGPALQHPLRPGRGHLHGHPPAQDRGQHPPGAVGGDCSRARGYTVPRLTRTR